jgi:hypothetical protein
MVILLWETECTYLLLKLQPYPLILKKKKKKKLIHKVNTILLIRVKTKYVIDSFTLKNEQIFCTFFSMIFFLALRRELIN